MLLHKVTISDWYCWYCQLVVLTLKEPKSVFHKMLSTVPLSVTEDINSYYFKVGLCRRGKEISWLYHRETEKKVSCPEGPNQSVAYYPLGDWQLSPSRIVVIYSLVSLLLLTLQVLRITFYREPIRSLYLVQQQILQHFFLTFSSHNDGTLKLKLCKNSNTHSLPSESPKNSHFLLGLS